MVVHGPVILCRASGIVAGLRCVFAHPEGLELHFVLRASGVQAEAASRQGQVPGSSHPKVHVQVNDRDGVAHPTGGPITTGDDRFFMQTRYWIDELPFDRRVHITVAWPEAGMPETQRVIMLDDLSGLPERVLPLL
ncbi:hypothetical protein [Intrasporangium calvum]|uniref:hypothetical protein n=1 Tax=Intrasporangium calvum TaxID=53358 RepID=UPI000DF5F1C2|nr:hypothetical protein [Intrasporangium calvum]AXG12614.1 hypothetical protein DN585_03500 [Intrasporangium calvum]